MSDPSSENLHLLLHSLESEGRLADSGSFTIDPDRAIEILRGQGRLGQSAPLYLLSALFRHTQGGPISRSSSLRSWRLEWDGGHGPLPSTLDSLLAEASFAARGVQMIGEGSAVLLRPAQRSRAAGAILDPIFREVSTRLDFFPWKDAKERPAPLRQAAHEGVVWQVLKGGVAGHFHHVVRGVLFPSRKRWPVPADVVCHDPWAQPDLTLREIPDSKRVAHLQAIAEQVFLEFLREEIRQSSPCVLDPYQQDRPLSQAALYLPYLLSQRLDPELRERAADLVRFVDCAGREWTAGQLREIEAREGKIMVVESKPAPEVSEGLVSDRPILLWGGQAEQVGGRIFQRLATGTGYLYSMLVNEKERHRRGEARLASLDIEEGRLSLLSWGEPDRVGEVEFVGPRRARQTFYLDSEAPRGLRLLWETRQGLPETCRELVMDGPLRQAVAQLVDSSLGSAPSPDCLVQTLLWALAPGGLDWSKLAALASAPLLELAGGGLASVLQLRNWARSGPLAVLRDRSTSLPAELPMCPILWWHPLLDALGLSTVDVGREVREAYWREVGRERWLSAHSPGWPDWPPGWQACGPHRRARQADPEASTEVVFWREGRPFGRRILPPAQCPPGYLLLWVEDEMPADTYWSGPDPAAVARRLPEIVGLCQG